MRDDISSLPIPGSAKRYARMKGAFGVSPGKLKLHNKVLNTMLNTKRGGSIKIHDEGAKTESKARQIINFLLDK